MATSASLKGTLLLHTDICCFSPDSCATNMGDSHEDTSATMPEAVPEEVSLFSTTDMVLFSLIVGVLTYWFIFRKKKEEIPEFSKIQTT